MLKLLENKLAKGICFGQECESVENFLCNEVLKEDIDE